MTWAPLHPPRRCRLCRDTVVFAPRWCCTMCFLRLDPELKGRVWEIADLPEDDPRKARVIADCVRRGEAIPR